MPFTTPSAPGRSSTNAVFPAGEGAQLRSAADSRTRICDSAESRCANNTGFAHRDQRDASGAQTEKISSRLIIVLDQERHVRCFKINNDLLRDPGVRAGGL